MPNDVCLVNPKSSHLTANPSARRLQLTVRELAAADQANANGVSIVVFYMRPLPVPRAAIFDKSAALNDCMIANAIPALTDVPSMNLCRCYVAVVRGV
jgi:hypothetical protein